MRADRSLFERIRNRGEQVLTQLSAELTQNPRFVKAVEGAMRGREKLEQAAAKALRQMKVPSQGELRRANARIETLEREVAELRRSVRSRAAAGRPKVAGKGRAASRGGARRRARKPKPAASAE